MKASFIIALVSICFANSAFAQKGEKSIAIGPIVSIPTQRTLYTDGLLNTGAGIEVAGQSNITKKSALLLQTNLLFFSYEDWYSTYNSSPTAHTTLLSVRGGYQYQFARPAIFFNGLAGIETELSDLSVDPSLTIGMGKRFSIQNSYFVDAGIEYVLSNFNNRVNVKVAFSILRRPKPDGYKLW